MGVKFRQNKKSDDSITKTDWLELQQLVTDLELNHIETEQHITDLELQNLGGNNNA